MSAVLAVDFGTSNTGAAVMEAGRLRRLEIEAGGETLPTAVFFGVEGDMRIGAAAARALIDGDEGRYMRALKSVLGTPLFHESRLLGGRRRTLADVVVEFLTELKARAEARAGRRFEAVLSGRPVRFHHEPERDQTAEADLRACYLAAGFDHVAFMFEPEAAALASEGARGETGLVVDIGGGTSDFTVFRRETNGVEVVASHGIRLGGTDFDRTLSLAFAMPELGRGGQLRRELGEGLLPVPQAIYGELATWATIPFLYTRETERLVEDLLRHAVDRPRMARLQRVIRDHLGHDVAFAVEAGKIAANSGDAGAGIDLGVVEKGLWVRMGQGMANAALAEHGEDLKAAIYETLMRAEVPPAGVDQVVLVGGSSLMEMVVAQARAVCPDARIARSEAFTGVVDGLAIATA